MDKLRLFVAADLPDNLKKEIAGGISCVPPERGLKWVKSFQLHFTLKFLGYLEEDKVPQVKEYVAKVAGMCPPLALRLDDCGAFPRLAQARVVWLGCAGDTVEMAELARGIDNKMTRLGVEKEKRPFKPHLTLARSRDPRNVTGTVDALREWLTGRPAMDFLVGSAVLYQSILDATGPTYVRLEEFELGGQR